MTAQPLLVICRHCYQPAVGSYSADDGQVWVCRNHTPDGVVLAELPLVEHQFGRPRRRRVRHIQVAS